MADDDPEGEEAPEEETSVPVVPDTGLRNRFCIGVIAGQDTELAEFQQHLQGIGGFFQVVGKNELLAVEDEDLAAELSGLSESEEPIPPEVFAKLLKATIDKPPPESELSLPEDERPSSELCRIKKGPREFCFLFDFPQTVEQFNALQDSAQFDAVILMTAPPKEKSGEEEGGDGEAAEEQVGRTKSAAFEDPSQEDPEDKPKVGRVKVFEDLQKIAETQFEKSTSHADVAFGNITMLEEHDDTLDALAQVLSVIVKAKIEYLDWMKDAPVVETFPAPVDLRHYDTTLSALKPSCMSVPLILNALVDQVCLIAAPEGSVCHNPRDGRAANRGNKAILASMESALYSLNAPLPPRQTLAARPKPSIPIFMYGDDQAYRMGEPSLTQAQRDEYSEQENSLTRLRDPLPLKHPPQPGMNEEEVGLELTELLTMTPKSVSAKQVSHALLLSEFERLVQYRTDDKGAPLNIDAWVMEEVNLESFTYQEDFESHALQQVLNAALSPAMGVAVEAVCGYYPREDLVLLALCNKVPFSRVSEDRWNSELPAFLGFWQWLRERFDLAEEERQRLEEEASQLQINAPPEEEAEEDAAKEGEGAEREGGEGAGEDGEVSGETSKVSSKAPAPLPLPDPPKGPVFRMDRERARLWDAKRVVLLSGGARVCVGESQAGKYIALDAAPHVVHLRQEQRNAEFDEEEARGFAVSVTYEDGASVLARRDTHEGFTILTVGLPSGLSITLRSDGVVWQCHPSARALAPLDWTRYCKEEEKRPRPRGQVLVEGDVVKSMVAKAEMESVKVVGECSVLVRHRDGETDILMPGGSAGINLGVGCGWLWTNPEGLRQIRGAPKAMFAFPAPPVEVQERLQPESGEVVTVRSDLVMTVVAKDGRRLVQHADGTQIVTLPAEDDQPSDTQHIICEGMASVQLGPDISNRCITAADGTQLQLLGQHMILARPDGSRLQVALSGGKVVFLPEGDMQQAEKSHANADGMSYRSRRSKMPSTGAASVRDDDARSVAQSRRGSKEGNDGAMTARTAQSETRSVKSHKSGKSEATHGGADGWGAGAFVMSMVTGSFHTEDANGNIYSVTSKGELKNTIQAVQALKKRNADAISAADEARNKMAMDTSGLSDLRPPSPKIEHEPGPRLEPFRLLCVRRDGSGYELLSAKVAERRVRLAKLSGMTVMEEEIPDEGPGATSVTILQKDVRGSRMPTAADQLVPAMMQHPGLRPRPAEGTLKALRMSHLLKLPTLDRPTMQQLRLASPSHLDWRSSCAEAADALYVPDPRPVERVDDETSLQQRIAAARSALPGRLPSPPPTSPSRYRRASTHFAADTAGPAPSSPSRQRTPGSRPGTQPQPPRTGTTHTATSGSVAVAQEASREEHDWEAGAEAVGGRIFLCEPGEAWFGELASRRVYRLKLMLLNKSPFLAKFRIRQPKTSSVSVLYSPAPVAAGMTVNLEVEVRSWPPGEIHDELKVVSEEDEFAVPIFANVVEVADEQAVQDGGYMEGTSNQVLLAGALQKAFTVKPKTANLTGGLPGVTTTQNIAVRTGTMGATQTQPGGLAEVEDRGRKQRLRQKQLNSGVVPVAEPS